jgi:hypothetical protein
MQTQTATNYAHDFIQEGNPVNETTLASIWAIVLFIGLMIFGFNI